MQLSDERSFSPASRGQRSQDSGFSDSDCSSNPRSPRHRRRRKSNRKKSKEINDQNAVLTSTPKLSNQNCNRPRITPEQLDELSRHLDFSFEDR